MIRCTFVSCSKSMGLIWLWSFEEIKICEWSRKRYSFIDLLTWDSLYYFYTNRKLVSNIYRGRLQAEAATKIFELYYKRDFGIGDFPWIFKNNFFTEHLRATASAQDRFNRRIRVTRILSAFEYYNMIYNIKFEQPIKISKLHWVIIINV